MIFFSDLSDQTAGVTNGEFTSDPYDTVAEVTTIHVFSAAGQGSGSAQVTVEMSTDGGTTFTALVAAMNSNEAVNVYGEIGIKLRLKVRGIDRTTTMSATTGTA